MATTDEELRSLMQINLEYSYEQEEWVFPLVDALHGLTAVQAAWRPATEGAMGVWDIVLHLAVWNRNIVERIETGESARPAQGAWPHRGEVLDEANWEAAKWELWSSIEALREVVAHTPVDKIKASPYGLPDLLCRFTHLAYHAGQIVKLRECKGW